MDPVRSLPTLLFCLVTSAPVGLQARALGASSQLTGKVLDEARRPVPEATVLLVNRISGYRQVVKADIQGRFTLSNIPFNDYHLEVVAPQLEMAHRNVELRSTLPVEMEMVLKTLGATVAVTETLSVVEEHPSTHIDIDKSSIQFSPAPVQSRALESILLATPGFTQNENGRFHFRGSHGQVMFVVDGIPVTDQMQTTFSNSLDPSQVESMEIITGGISAEYGGKPAAVINMTTKSGLGAPKGFEGEVSLGAARFATTEAGLSVRGGSERFGYFVTGALSQSDRFLDVVSFDNFNNHGTTGRLFTRFDWVLGDQDTLRASIAGGDTHRRVMNLASQQAIGQNSKTMTSDFNLSLAWSHLLSPRQSFEASLFFRHAEAALLPTQDLHPGFQPGGPDSPYWAKQDRSLENQGFQAAYTQRFTGDSTLKAGLQHVVYPIREAFHFAVTQDGLFEVGFPLYAFSPAGGGAIWHFEDRITPRLASVFVQNDLHLDNWFLALGLRYDRYTVKNIAQGQLQPRLGMSYRIPSTRTVFRTSYDRLLITRENENLALSLSQLAWDLGPYSGTPVPALKPELQDSFNAGIEQQLGASLRFMMEYWEKHSRNAADSGQFLNTGVAFPVGLTRGQYHGWNVRLDLAPVAGFSGYLSLGKTRARVQAPVVGGLQLNPPEVAPGEWFLIDHDQKLAGQLGLHYERQGFHFQAIGRYDSGLVSGDPADAAGDADYAFGIPYVHQDAEGIWRSRARTVWAFSAAQEFQLIGRQRLSLGADLLNAFDKRALFTYLSGCGGTHVIPPRTWAVHVKYSF
jgi:hypothetical protein